MEKQNKNSAEELVIQAKAGDKYAQSQLYEQYYNTIYYTIKTIIKDEDTTLDLVQDTFFKGFTHLDSLSDTSVFLAWLKRIATNNAKNWLRKKQPLLFSQMVDEDDEGNEQPVDFQDMDLTKQPEEALDAKTKKQLLWDIINELSDEQRLVINMFYFQRMAVTDIAQMLEVSPNTVKSRLNYGRKKIEAKVLELEKNGTKLYGLAPLAFFIWLFMQNQKVNPVLPVAISTAAGAGSAAASTSTGTTVAQGKAVSGAAKATAHTAAKGIGAKVAAGATAVAIAGGAIVGITVYNTPKLYSWYMEPSVTAQDINVPIKAIIEYVNDESYASWYWESGYDGGAYYIKTDTGVGIITSDGEIIAPATYNRISVEENNTLVLHDDTGNYAVSVPDGTITPYTKPEKQVELEEWFDQKTEKELETYTPDKYTLYNFTYNGPGVYSNNKDSSLYKTPVEDVGGVQEGFAAYMLDSKWGYLDETTMEPVIEAKYAPAWHIDESVMDISNLYYYRYSFFNGYFFYRPESTNAKEGKGTFHKDRAYDVSDGYIVVNVEGKGYSLITTDEKTVIPAGKFYQMRPVYNGKLWVQEKENGPWGIIELDKEAITEKLS